MKACRDDKYIHSENIVKIYTFNNIIYNMIC